MEATSYEPKDLRKLIDIPRHILADLKKLAVENNKSLKAFIQDHLVEHVEIHRRSTHHGDSSRSRNSTTLARAKRQLPQ